MLGVKAEDEGMDRTKKKEKQVRKQGHMIGLLLVCLFLFVVGAMVLTNLNNTRKELIKECENNLLWEVKLTAKEVTEDVNRRLIELDVVQEKIARAYSEGADIISKLKESKSKSKYKLSHLGFIDLNYVYYDMDGDIVTEIRTENVDAAMEGRKVIARSVDAVSGDGVAFFVPCMDGDTLIGVIVAKISREELLKTFSVKQQDGTELVIDASGQVVLMEDDFGNYLDGMSWEEFSTNGAMWKGKPKFDEEMQLAGCSVASAKSKNGKDIYFAAAKVGEYDGFYVVRLTSSEVVEAEIKDSMVRLTVLMVLMSIFMLFVIVAALVVYIRNRKAVYNAAYVDQLTGIPSKAKHKLDAQILIDRQEYKYAYVTFDVDNFKYVNEMFGYEYGNKILVHIAKVVKLFAKKDELYARVSSDNFAMMLKDNGTEEDLSKRIHELFELILEYREPEEELAMCALKFSCGVFRINEKTDINTVRANANLAREESKKRILEDIVYFNEELKSLKVEEKELEYDAEEALKNGEFLVYFQPKFNVETEKIIGAEALIRWNHPVRGMISPGQFVPVFELNGFIIPLDLFVLDCVCSLIGSWIKDGIPPICISVNLSRVHLIEENLVEQLIDVVDKHNVPREYIEFELTESAFYEETGSLLRIMAQIKDAGFRLSMDDFGSGYSSLNLLRTLPVDVLKLDRVFLEDCEEENDETRGKRIVTHVISMAKDLKMAVLAEGVETKYQKEFLQTAKCDMIQGYYYARPMPLKEFELLYKGQNCLHSTVHQPPVEHESEDPA